MADDVKINTEDIRAAEADLSKVRDDMGTLDHLGPEKVERMRLSRAKKMARKRLKKAAGFNEIIDAAIKLFSEGEFYQGAEAIAEIAHLWKSSGQTLQAYLDLMTYIEDQAIKNSGSGEMLRFQIRDALRDYSAKKRGSVIIQ